MPSLHGTMCEFTHLPMADLLLIASTRPSKELLSVQDATSIVHPALGLMATPVLADEPLRTFKDCLGESHKVIEERKKEQASWARGIDPTKPRGKDDAESDSKERTEAENAAELKADIDRLTKGASSYAKELSECVVDSGEYPRDLSPTRSDLRSREH